LPDDQVEFTFSWLALRLLGRGLYSNTWSAISELVANGFDAGASVVRVSLDIVDKEHATIEIVDNGTGMSRTDIDTYVKVGHDKRAAASLDAGGSDLPMGRKGIGKLAALYLSDNFFIQTRRDGIETTWNLDARNSDARLDEHPVLRAVDTMPATHNGSMWHGLHSGTFLSLQNVDLRGKGSQSLADLGSQLANHFLLGEHAEQRQILLAVRSSSTAPLEYRPVEKNVAFANMAYIATRYPLTELVPEDLRTSDRIVRIPSRFLPNNEYVHPVEFHDMELAPDTADLEWGSIEERVDLEARTFDDVQFALTGWVGIHATISKAAARQNDIRFTKNKFYNPAQLRLYVRGKLASDRLLNQLGFTSTYLNYIEGELSFDILDDSGLPDIATSNRQDFDETDDRVTLLRTLVRPIVRRLIDKRMSLAAAIREAEQRDKRSKENLGKEVFSRQLAADLAGYDLPKATRDDIQTLATMKIRGEVTTKSRFKVFISHSSADKGFSDLVYELLKFRGADDSEIFYTSRSNGEQYGDARSLGTIIKESITDVNSLIFYVTSKNFKASEYCLFEGGAGWATRSVRELIKLNVDYESIPDFLSENRPELTLLNMGVIELRQDTYSYIVSQVLNPMIRHLNEGRAISGGQLLEEFGEVDFPSAVELGRLGASFADYFDDDIALHWEVYVSDSLQDYMRAYGN
jgi:hypothetical protein